MRRLLKKLGYSLRANIKRLSGPPHPDRDRQFRYIHRRQREFLKAGQPVISADAKNSKLVGNFKNDGSLWCAEADEVNTYDFPNEAECRAIPYGVYDLAARRGHVNVGTSGNTGSLKVTAQLDHRRYATKIKISDGEMKELNITRQKTCQ